MKLENNIINVKSKKIKKHRYIKQIPYKYLKTINIWFKDSESDSEDNNCDDYPNNLEIDCLKNSNNDYISNIIKSNSFRFQNKNNI